MLELATAIVPVTLSSCDLHRVIALHGVLQIAMFVSQAVQLRIDVIVFISQTDGGLQGW